MVSDGGFVSVPAVFHATVSIAQTIYDLKAVGEQAKNLFSSTNHISSTLNTIRTLRRQKDDFLSDMERNHIDGVCKETESILKGIATLLEPARVDMDTSGRVSLFNRGMFVLRDSPKVESDLTRLNLTSQGLIMAMVKP